MLPLSIENRVLKLVENEIDVMEAIKQAFNEEQKFIEEMISQKSERSIKAKETMCKNTYHLLNLIS